jgi:uncharacterized protein YifE (UPF0438 family)
MEIYAVPKGLNLKELFPLKRFKFTEITLSPDEKALLRRHGTALSALRDGIAIPFTPKQKHFVEVCKGLVEPNTKQERVWLKYISMLEDEKRLAELHREELRNSPEREKYLQSRFLGSVDTKEKAPNVPMRVKTGKDKNKKCPVCKGAGYDCQRCGGSGWIDRN